MGGREVEVDMIDVDVCRLKEWIPFGYPLLH